MTRLVEPSDGPIAGCLSESRHEFRNMQDFFRQILCCLALRLALEELLVFLEHEGAGSATGHDPVVPGERLNIEAGIVLHQVNVPIGFDRRAGTTLRGQGRFDSMFA